jgi:hypothetical protein
MTRPSLVVSFVFSVCALFFVTSMRSDRGPSRETPSNLLGSAESKTPPAKIAEQFGKIPLAFEANIGQASSDVRFLTRAAGATLLLRDQEALLLLPDKVVRSKGNSSQGRSNFSMLRIEFAGATKPKSISAQELQAGTSNYLLGNDPARWHTRIPNYGRVRYHSIYPGVDLVFYGNGRQLEHDFIVAPGADYSQIALKLDGAQSISVETNGSAKIETAVGELRLSSPTIYQVSDGQRYPVEGRLHLKEPGLISFEVGPYDKKRPLIIDPVLSYSTYLAGSQSEQGAGIAVDGAGSAYVTGLTFSADFPTTPKAFDGTCNACPNSAAIFITKLNPTGTGLVYSTFLGGSNYNQPFAITIDADGDAIVTGLTQSTDFPTKNPIKNSAGPGGFVSSLNRTGTELKFSTYLGDTGSGLTTDADQNVFVAGVTSSSSFPVTPATNVIGIPPSYGTTDTFVAKLTSNGHLVFATVIGSVAQQSSSVFFQVNNTGIAVDSKGDVYLAGAASLGFPATSGAFQTNYTGPAPFCGSCTMGYIAELNPAGSAFVYATYLGGSGGDQATGLAIDSSGNAYVTGNTNSTDFPTTPGAFQTQLLTSGGFGGTFITKLNPTGTALGYSTYLGGTATQGLGNFAAGIALDSSGDAFVTGFTRTLDFPLMNPVQSTVPANGNSAYVTEMNPLGTALLFSTVFGGSTGTQSAGIALDSSGNAYITGATQSTDLPTTPGAFQTAVTSPDHAFVTKFNLAEPAPALCFSNYSLFFFASINTSAYPTPVQLTNCGNAPLSISQIVATAPFTASHDCPRKIASSASCVINVGFHPTAPGFFSGTVQISDNVPLQPQFIQLQGIGTAPIVQLSTTSLTLDDQLVGDTGLATPIFVFNQGDDVLRISSLTIEGQDFLKGNECDAPVEPGGACVIVIRFHPLAPGLRSGLLTISDNAPGSPQTVTLQGNGLTAYPVPTISTVTPNMILESSGTQSIQVYGTGFFQSSIVRVNGVHLATKYAGESSLTAILPAKYTGTLGELAIDVFTPVPGGGLSNSMNIVTYQDLALSANSLVYEPFSRRLYASISNSAPANANTIVSIDPVTQTVGAPIAIGNGPNKLAVSDNGEFLYVGLDIDHAVQQFNTVSGALGSRTALPTDLQDNTLNASAIQMVPTQAQIYVVSLIPQYGGLAEGVSLISAGKSRSTIFSSFTQYFGLNSIGFLSSPNAFYGTDGATVWQFAISKETLSVSSSASAPLVFSQFVSDRKDLFVPNGLEYNPVSNQIVGTYQLQFPGAYTPSVFPDTAIGLTYFLTLANPSLAAFSQTTFTQVGSLLLPSNIISPSQLVRWGQDGFAFLNFNYSTDTSDVILLRSSLALPSPGPNPSPTISGILPASAQSSGPANFKLAVQGSDFVPGAVVQWNGSNRTTEFVNSKTLVADVSANDISSAGTAQVTVSNPVPGGGTSNARKFTIN